MSTVSRSHYAQPDELFARVARWWDREAEVREKRALLAYAYADTSLERVWWADLQGDLRWRLVASVRGMTGFGVQCQRLIDG